MRNFLALLGWSPGEDREIMTEAEMIALFSLEGIQKKPAVFDTTKLEWMNGQYLSLLPVKQLVEPVARELAKRGIASAADLIPYIDTVKARSRTLIDLADQVAVRLAEQAPRLDEKGEQFVKKLGPGYAQGVSRAYATLSAIPATEWKRERILETLKQTVAEAGIKLGDLLQPIRVAVTGSVVSEPVNELLEVVGREKSLTRLKAAEQQS
jgi:glutamyl-tRNA synthetase